MQQMMFIETGVVRWDEAPEPEITSADQAIVRPVAVATCDLDTGALRGSYPLPGPYPFGHEAVAEVVEVGHDVTGVARGDLVVVPFQISCGSCRSCRRGRTGNCASHPRMSTYGLGTMGGLQWGGLLADLALVPHADAMLVPVPTGVDPLVVASASDNIADAWRTVGPQLADDPEVEVLVVGGDAGPNSIGLYAAGLAVALGSQQVTYSDVDADRLTVAASLGAQPVEGPPQHKLGSFPVTVDASGTEAGLRCALNSTAFDGTCTSPSIYFDDPAIPMFSMYSRCCTLHTGRAHARTAVPAVLELVTAGFDPSLVTSAVCSWSDAAAALADPPMKLVIDCNDR